MPLDDELKETFEGTFGIFFEMNEKVQVQIYQLITLLMKKGIITQDDYDKYLSIEATDDVFKKIDEKLSEEGL